MRRLVFSLALAAGFVVLALPSSAGADRNHSASIRLLRTQLRALRAQVHALRAERNALQAVLASATVRAVKTRRRVVRNPLTVAVGQVRREAEWAQGSRTTPLQGQLVAEAAMDYVVGHVSTGAYGYFEMVYSEPPGGQDLPPYSEPVNTILATQTGICVHAERTFAAIVKALGFRVRDIGFDFVDPNGEQDSHSAAEVYYSGGWHFFDPTFGQFWTDAGGDVLPIAAVRATGGFEHRDDAAFTNLIEDRGMPTGRDTWFETDPATTVVVGGGRR